MSTAVSAADDDDDEFVIGGSIIGKTSSPASGTLMYAILLANG